MALLFLLACQQNTKEPSYKYGLISYDSLENKVHLTRLNSLMDPKEIGPRTEVNFNGFILAQKDSRYFVMDQEQKSFVCYQVDEKGIKALSMISMKDIPWEPYMSWVNWIDAHTILIGTVNNHKFNYLEIDLDAMKINRKGLLNVPETSADNNYVGVSGQFIKDKLFVSYTFQKGMMREHIVPCDDTMYLAQFNYPDLTLENTAQDHRTTWPGSYAILAPNSLVYQDNIYVLGQPGGRTGNRKGTASAILKIDTEKNNFDPSYNFKVADGIQEEAYTLHDIGDGLAISSVVQLDKVHSFENYMINRVANYVVLDLKHQKKTQLNLPDVQLDWIFNTIWDEDFAYISVYQQDGKSQIWQYNRKAATLKKGVLIKGAVVRISRLEK
ncbi:hypothetical protein [Pedobacter gandavensis]|uniref:DUF4374 domain-containing protein n=1 Tax=Pedobacter gandavensis TaxID=2679963 RepID=A0ABR6EXR6_9SPHI|nr:hypothetical protein [Pedobacter gandavensis]MBB2150080.1 hypothetical protein [Pedobacter gandavensis]